MHVGSHQGQAGDPLCLAERHPVPRSHELGRLPLRGVGQADRVGTGDLLGCRDRAARHRVGPEILGIAPQADRLAFEMVEPGNRGLVRKRAGDETVGDAIIGGAARLALQRPFLEIAHRGTVDRALDDVIDAILGRCGGQAGQDDDVHDLAIGLDQQPAGHVFELLAHQHGDLAVRTQEVKAGIGAALHRKLGEAGAAQLGHDGGQIGRRPITRGAALDCRLVGALRVAADEHHRVIDQRRRHRGGANARDRHGAVFGLRDRLVERRAAHRLNRPLQAHQQVLSTDQPVHGIDRPFADGAPDRPRIAFRLVVERVELVRHRAPGHRPARPEQSPVVQFHRRGIALARTPVALAPVRRVLVGLAQRGQHGSRHGGRRRELIDPHPAGDRARRVGQRGVDVVQRRKLAGLHANPVVDDLVVEAVVERARRGVRGPCPAGHVRPVAHRGDRALNPHRGRAGERGRRDLDNEPARRGPYSGDADRLGPRIFGQDVDRHFLPGRIELEQRTDMGALEEGPLCRQRDFARGRRALEPHRPDIEVAERAIIGQIVDHRP